jgi:transcription elongation factor/antiterminator RfaH
MLRMVKNQGEARPADGLAACEMPSAKGWRAVQCQPSREAKAQWHLQNQGFKIFLPQRRRTRRHARKIETVLRPFFPGYLFIELDLTRDRWRSVNGTVGVARLVMQGEKPACVPQGVVEALQAACDASGVMDFRPALRPGEAVRVVTGAFTDLVGELIRMDDAGRVRVLLNILGGEVPVLLSRECVVSAHSAL